MPFYSAIGLRFFFSPFLPSSSPSHTVFFPKLRQLWLAHICTQLESYRFRSYLLYSLNEMVDLESNFPVVCTCVQSTSPEDTSKPLSQQRFSRRLDHWHWTRAVATSCARVGVIGQMYDICVRYMLTCQHRTSTEPLPHRPCRHPARNSGKANNHHIHMHAVRGV